VNSIISEKPIFKHFVITRFNIKYSLETKNGNQENIITDQWLKNRFDIFEKFCFPSICHQSNQNFIWLIYFDSNTPPAYREKVAGYAKVFENMVPRFISGQSVFLESVIMDVKEFTSNEQQYIITTRIDNDDVLHKNAISVIQYHFQKQDNIIIDLRKGYCLQIVPDFLLTRFYFPFNQFISLIEKFDNFQKPRTVYCRKHQEWRNYARVIAIDNDYYWLQLIHNENIINKIHGPAVIKIKILRDFAINQNFRIDWRYFWHYLKRNSFFYLKKILPPRIKKILSGFRNPIL
jgi:hypothetical protein